MKKTKQPAPATLSSLTINADEAVREKMATVRTIAEALKACAEAVGSAGVQIPVNNCIITGSKTGITVHGAGGGGGKL